MTFVGQFHKFTWAQVPLRLCPMLKSDTPRNGSQYPTLINTGQTNVKMNSQHFKQNILLFWNWRHFDSHCPVINLHQICHYRGEAHMEKGQWTLGSISWFYQFQLIIVVIFLTAHTRGGEVDHIFLQQSRFIRLMIFWYYHLFSFWQICC